MREVVRCPVLPLLQVSRILLLPSVSRPVVMVLLMKASRHPTVKIIARATQSMHMLRSLIRGLRRWIWIRPSQRLRSNDNPSYISFFFFSFFGPMVIWGSFYVFLFHGKRVSFFLDLSCFLLGFRVLSYSADTDFSFSSYDLFSFLVFYLPCVRVCHLYRLRHGCM